MPDLDALERELRRLGRVVVAFSGGADSAFLAWMAHRTLGRERTLAVTAVSPSLPATELEECERLAAEWGLRWTTVDTDEMSNPAYTVNDGDRCYWCKTALMDALAPVATTEDATVVLGVNVDDLGEHRPGQRAAAESGAAFPMVAAGFTKADVRSWSARLGLRTWDKPAAACLSSRLPYGTAVTVSVLSRVERAEAGLHGLGFRTLRVRHYGDAARLEVPVDDMERVLAHRAEVVDALHDAGYHYATLDLEGLRSGNLNDALVRAEPLH
jgi:uncharacterized protein